MKMYAYAKAHQMVDHRFTDDVAITMAKSKKEAVELFQFLYGNCKSEDVRVFSKRFLRKNIVILTDY